MFVSKASSSLPGQDKLYRIAELALQKVFTCFVRLHDSYAMHEIFSPGFPGLLEALYVQERILERMMPSVYDVFVSSFVLLPLGVSPTSTSN
jgi:hypothetical protein